MAKNRNPDPPNHLSGKRRWSRQTRSISVVCVGIGTSFRGLTIDISRGGMLVEAHDGELTPVGDDLVPLAYLVAVAFGKGMKAILGTDVSVTADVIRVTTSPVDRGYLRLGCRFRRALTRRQCAQVGIDDTDAPDPTLDFEPEMDLDSQLSASTRERASDHGSQDDE